MGRRGHGVGRVEERLSGGRDPHALVGGRVTGDDDGLDARRDGPVAVDKDEKSRFGQGFEPGGHVARLVPLDRMERLFPFAALDDIAGPGKGGRPGPVGLLQGVAAAVVEVEVAVDHDVDAVGAEAELRQRFEKPRPAVEGIEIRVPPADVGPDARVEKERRVRGPDEVAVQGQRDPVLEVGGGLRSPERPRDDAEHGPAVDPERPVEKPDDLGIADPDPIGRRAHGLSSGTSSPARVREASRISPVSMRMASTGQASTQKPQKQQRLRSTTNLAGSFWTSGSGSSAAST